MALSTSIAFFTVSCFLLCASCIAYCEIWKNTELLCFDHKKLVTVLFAVSSAIYGISGLISAAFCAQSLFCNGCRVEKSIMAILSGATLIYSIVTGVVILVNLPFNFDPNCVKGSGSDQILFVFLWIIVAASVICPAMALLFAIFSKEESVSTNLPSHLPSYISSAEVQKQPIETIA